MHYQPKKFWAALASGAGMVAVGFFEAVTTVGWPPKMPANIPWTFVLFAAFAFLSFFSLLWENLGLKTPHLEIVYDPTRPPFVHDKLGVDGKTLRIHRVGVRNTGASAEGVGVKLLRCEPLDRGAVYPGHELWPMGHPADTLSVTVHKSGDEPMVFFDVIGQLFLPDQPSEHLHLRYAAQGLHGRKLSHDAYRMTLAIHGEGASSPVDFIVEKDGDGMRWVLRTA